MALTTDIEALVKLVPTVRDAPGGVLWMSYDAEADALYGSIKKPEFQKVRHRHGLRTDGKRCDRPL